MYNLVIYLGWAISQLWSALSVYPDLYWKDLDIRGLGVYKRALERINQDHQSMLDSGELDLNRSLIDLFRAINLIKQEPLFDGEELDTDLDWIGYYSYDTTRIYVRPDLGLTQTEHVVYHESIHWAFDMLPPDELEDLLSYHDLIKVKHPILFTLCSLVGKVQMLLQVSTPGGYTRSDALEEYYCDFFATAQLLIPLYYLKGDLYGSKSQFIGKSTRVLGPVLQARN